MKIDFKDNTFSASMNEEAPIIEISHVPSLHFLKNNKPLFFGVLAFLISLINIPFGIFMNLSTEFLIKIFEVNASHWISVLFVFSACIITASLTFSILALVCYPKSKKAAYDKIGIAISILTFAICAIGITFSILGLCTW